MPTIMCKEYEKYACRNRHLFHPDRTCLPNDPHIFPAGSLRSYNVLLNNAACKVSPEADRTGQESVVKGKERTAMPVKIEGLDGQRP